MTTKTVEKELLGLERQYWQAIKDKDVDAAMRLSDDPCIVAGAQGIGSLDRKSLGGMMRAASYTLNDFEFSDDAKVRLLSADVAIVAYKVREDLTVEGKPVSFEASESSTWVRRDGRWVCALHSESLAGDPFGRDRRPAS
jgi:ketosteroid isomerase-like protein